MMSPGKVVEIPGEPASIPLTAAARAALRGTRPWVKFLGVMAATMLVIFFLEWLAVALFAIFFLRYAGALR